MHELGKVAAAVDRMNDCIGRATAWIAITMVVVQFIVVVMRYVFGIGSIMMQESVTYMHGILFMIGAGYTLLHDGHVRVDIFYRDAKDRTKALVDLFGSLLLLFPVIILIFIASYPYVVQAWASMEGSVETSGIPAVYLLKSIILVFCVLLGLQGVSLFIRSLITVMGGTPIAHHDDRSVPHG
ncbi:TRAP transporter small permease subunit [Thalassobaculum sp.]|uniref:TRAP transporter small permease subunit n=1 Tax=Thalassobaculum sp. TaxID=2022740 RepID=UPI0032EBC31F